MCIGFWALEHPNYALILCSNRDEFLSRPTEPAHFHSFDHPGDLQQVPSVLSGRDMQAGGTWLGINRRGRVALLTNITEPVSSYKLSRGHLVSSFLSPESPSRALFIKNLTEENRPEYAGFNLLLFSPASVSPLSYNADLITNSGGNGSITSRPLHSVERRCFGLSNGVDGLGGNEWPKVQVGQAAFAKILDDFSAESSEEELTERLFEMLTWVALKLAAPLTLTGRTTEHSWQSEALPLNRAQLRSSIHIPPIRITPSLSPDARADGPEYYGTRLSTVILIRRDGEVSFVERDVWQMDSVGEVARADPRKQRAFRFKLD